MYLFNRRTRNIIKVFWGILATLVILSMIITYSGFTMLARTQPSQPMDVSPEDLQRPATTTLDVSSLSTTSPELQPLFESIRRDVASTSEPAPETPPAPDAPPLRLGL
jgi:Na+/H+-dicarboxylate symporter